MSKTRIVVMLRVGWANVFKQRYSSRMVEGAAAAAEMFKRESNNMQYAVPEEERVRCTGTRYKLARALEFRFSSPWYCFYFT